MSFRISLEEKSTVEKSINIEIPRAVYDKEFSRVLNQTAGRAHLKGFRPGKAPRAVVAKLYGEKIHLDIMEGFVHDAFREAVTENDLHVVGKPNVEILPLEQDKDVKVVAAVQIMPKPEIKDYFGVSCEVEVKRFSPKLVEDQLQQFQLSHASEVAVTDRKKVRDGDIVKLDYQGTINGESFQNSSAEDAPIELGNENLPAEIRKGLVGASLGETKNIRVEYPEGIQNEVLAGKTVDYVMTVKSMAERVLPELTDELVREHTRIETVEALKGDIEKRVRQEIEKFNAEATLEKVLSRIAEKNKFEVPQALVDNEIRRLLSSIYGRTSKVDVEKIEVEPFREILGEQAKKSVQHAIIVGRICAQEKIVGTDEDIERWLEKRAEEYAMDRQKVEKYLGIPEDRSGLKDYLAEEKTKELLLAKANITEVEVKSAE